MRQPPDLVVAVRCAPSWHPGHLDAVFDDSKQLGRPPALGRVRQIRRLGGQSLAHLPRLNARRTTASGEPVHIVREPFFGRVGTESVRRKIAAACRRTEFSMVVWSSQRPNLEWRPVAVMLYMPVYMITRPTAATSTTPSQKPARIRMINSPAMRRRYETLWSTFNLTPRKLCSRRSDHPPRSGPALRVRNLASPPARVNHLGYGRPNA